MLQFEPTKHGTGVKVIGDYGDLYGLYQTFLKLSHESNHRTHHERNRLLAVMSYEIRHINMTDYVKRDSLMQIMKSLIGVAT